ncbi:MAG: hypothetical protein RR416_03460 [Clostridia bacterium]
MDNYLVISPQKQAFDYARKLAEKVGFRVLVMEDYIDYFVGASLNRVIEVAGKEYAKNQIRKAICSIKDFQETVCLCGYLPFVECGILDSLTNFDVIVDKTSQQIVDAAIVELQEKCPQLVKGNVGKMRENIKKLKVKNSVQLIQL